MRGLGRYLATALDPVATEHLLAGAAGHSDRGDGGALAVPVRDARRHRALPGHFGSLGRGARRPDARRGDPRRCGPGQRRRRAGAGIARRLRGRPGRHPRRPPRRSSAITTTGCPASRSRPTWSPSASRSRPGRRRASCSNPATSPRPRSSQDCADARPRGARGHGGRRHRRAGPDRGRRGRRRPDRGDRPGRRPGPSHPRRRRPGGDPGVRRHPHALRRAGHVGSAPHAVVLARRDHGDPRQLRRGLRAGRAGSAHAGWSSSWRASRTSRARPSPRGSAGSGSRSANTSTRWHGCPAPSTSGPTCPTPPCAPT